MVISHMEDRLHLSAFVDKSNNALMRSLCPALSCQQSDEGNNILFDGEGFSHEKEILVVSNDGCIDDRSSWLR